MINWPFDSSLMNKEIWVLCLKCKVNIPQLSLTLINNKVQLKAVCTCSSLDQSYELEEYLHLIRTEVREYYHQCSVHKSRKGEVYCPDCSYWLCQECLACHKMLVQNHVTIANELHLVSRCHEHLKIKHDYFCVQCQESICSQCMFGDHLNHQIVQLNTLWNETRSAFEDYHAIANDYISKVEEIKTLLMMKIDQQILTLDEYKRIIELKYMENMLINKHLMELTDILMKNMLSSQSFPNYKLLNNLKSIVRFRERPTFTINYGSIDENVRNAIQFFLTNHVLTLPVSSKKKGPVIIIRGHKDSITGLVEAEDRRLISASKDKSLKYWDILHNRFNSTLAGHNAGISVLIQLQDGRLCTGSYDNTIKIWNNTSILSTITGHKEIITSLLQLKDGRIASGSCDKTIKLWNLNQLKALGTFQGHWSLVSALIQLKDGRLVSGSRDKTIKLWDLKTFQYITNLTGSNHSITALLQLKDSRLASASLTFSIVLWDLATYSCVAYLEGHCNCINALIQLEDGRLASGSKDKTIKLWNIDSHACIETIEDSSSVECLMQMQDGRLVSGCSDNLIKLWKI